MVGDSAEGVGYNGSASCGEGADRASISCLVSLTSSMLYCNWYPYYRHTCTRSGRLISPITVVLDVKVWHDCMKMNALVAAWRPGVEGGSGISSPGNSHSTTRHGLMAQMLTVVSPWYSKYCSEECPTRSNFASISGTCNTSAKAKTLSENPCYSYSFTQFLEQVRTRLLNVTCTSSSRLSAPNPMNENTTLPMRVRLATQ